MGHAWSRAWVDSQGMHIAAFPQLEIPKTTPDWLRRFTYGYGIIVSPKDNGYFLESAIFDDLMGSSEGRVPRPERINPELNRQLLTLKHLKDDGAFEREAVEASFRGHDGKILWLLWERINTLDLYVNMRLIKWGRFLSPDSAVLAAGTFAPPPGPDSDGDGGYDTDAQDAVRLLGESTEGPITFGTKGSKIPTRFEDRLCRSVIFEEGKGPTLVNLFCILKAHFDCFPQFQLYPSMSYWLTGSTYDALLRLPGVKVAEEKQGSAVAGSFKNCAYTTYADASPDERRQLLTALNNVGSDRSRFRTREQLEEMLEKDLEEWKSARERTEEHCRETYNEIGRRIEEELQMMRRKREPEPSAHEIEMKRKELEIERKDEMERKDEIKRLEALVDAQLKAIALRREEQGRLAEPSGRAGNDVDL